MSYRNDNVEKFIMNNSFLTKSVLKATRVLQFDVILSRPPLENEILHQIVIPMLLLKTLLVKNEWFIIDFFNVIISIRH